MEKLTLAVMPRTVWGKGPSRRLRRQGYIPAILYGKETEPVSLSVPERELRACARRGLRVGRMVELVWSDGTSPVTALLKELQVDPVTSRPLHMDFHLVLSTRPVEAELEVRLQGVPVGVRDQGGRLEQHVHHLKVRCLPDQLPEALIVDVSALEKGKSIHVGDLSIPGVTILADRSVVVAAVVAPRGEQVVAAAEEKAEEGEEAAEKPEKRTEKD